MTWAWSAAARERAKAIVPAEKVREIRRAEDATHEPGGLPGTPFLVTHREHRAGQAVHQPLGH